MKWGFSTICHRIVETAEVRSVELFDFTFTVRAPLTAVADLHRDTRALTWLTPPPVRVRIRHVEPLAEGSIADFTLWFGFLPIHWTASHSNVHYEHGFTDTQVRGPMKRWVHTHTFTDEGGGLSRITEHIEYEHFPGARGLLSRLLFTPFGLWLTFCYRRYATRRLRDKRSANTNYKGQERS